jgi:diguanylate cyclase (GGDEF)-like protein/PAS domain S-box-containing protein
MIQTTPPADVVLADLGEAVIVTDLDRNIVYWNRAAEQLYGWSSDEVLGRDVVEVTRAEVDEDHDRRVRQALEQGDSTFEDYWVIRRDGHRLPVLATITPLRSGDTLTGVVIVAADMTDRVRVAAERQRAQEALEHLALHDPLTGLPNRALIQDRLEQAMLRARRYGRRVAVIFGGIDRFQLINDTYGYSAGDELLMQVGARLTAATRASDTVGRFAGDEFVVVCEDIDDAAMAVELGQRMSSLFEQPFTVAGEEMYVTVACGVTLAMPDDTAASCLRDADSAMCRAKQLGGARVTTFDGQLRRASSRRLQLESALRHAVDESAFRLAYQPIIELVSGRIAGAEALLRWDAPDGAPIGPSEFVPVAEETGLIVRLGEWVIRQAASQVSKWRSHLPAARELTVSVNLSSQQLVPDLVGICKQVLETTAGTQRPRISFEITEHAVMHDVASSVGVLEQLSRLGLSLAIDDFGTGYSSLEYLKHLPVSCLKIDRSFVDGLGTDAQDLAIVRTVVELAKALGMDVVAEGVETDGQRSALAQLGCPHAQGYLWSRPLEAEAFARRYLASTAG